MLSAEGPLADFWPVLPTKPFESRASLTAVIDDRIRGHLEISDFQPRAGFLNLPKAPTPHGCKASAVFLGFAGFKRAPFLPLSHTLTPGCLDSVALVSDRTFLGPTGVYVHSLIWG